MAGEINFSFTLRCQNGNYDYNRTVQNTIDQTTAAGGSPGYQNIGTSHELIGGLADMTNEGIAVVRNLDDTNFVEVGLDVSASFYPLVKILPGEAYVMRLSPGVAVYAQADTAAVNLLFECLEA